MTARREIRTQPILMLCLSRGPHPSTDLNLILPRSTCHGRSVGQLLQPTPRPPDGLQQAERQAGQFRQKASGGGRQRGLRSANLPAACGMQQQLLLLHAEACGMWHAACGSSSHKPKNANGGFQFCSMPGFAPSAGWRRPAGIAAEMSTPASALGANTRRTPAV